jgi:hypothetical protein
MALKAQMLGRDKLEAKLNAIAPKAAVYAAAAKLQIAEDAASKIAQGAPRGATLEYAESIEGDFLKNRPKQSQVGIRDTKDLDAAGIFAPFIWRFLEWGTAPHNTVKGGGTKVGQRQTRAQGAQMHPGTRAQPHIFNVWRSMRAGAKKKIQAAVNKAVREVMKGG